MLEARVYTCKVRKSLKISTFRASFSGRKFAEKNEQIYIIRIHKNKANGEMSEVLPDQGLILSVEFIANNSLVMSVAIVAPVVFAYRGLFSSPSYYLHAFRVLNVAGQGIEGKNRDMLVGGKQGNIKVYNQVSRKWRSLLAQDCREGALTIRLGAAVVAATVLLLGFLLRNTLYNILHSGLIQWLLLLRSTLRISFYNYPLQQLFILLFRSLLQSRRSGMLSSYQPKCTL